MGVFEDFKVQETFRCTSHGAVKASQRAHAGTCHFSLTLSASETNRKPQMPISSLLYFISHNNRTQHINGAL